ncbi:MAG: desulfoferrodoxin [Phycisphaerae bacterium]|nr:desulfoferrodoxin [Phycisphaerae bacterium]
MREPGLIEANVSMGVDRLTDRDRPMELEKTHTPVIEAPERVRKGEPFACTIRLGAIPHDDKGSEHYVELVELFADRQYLTRIEFTPRSACRQIELTLCLDRDVRELRAYERCNLHGTWLGARGITVVD